MKETILIMMLVPSLVFAQIDTTKLVKVNKNEICINAFELVIGGVLPISYERFIDNNQSITVKTFFLDTNYGDFSENNQLFSLQTQYNFYFSEKKQNAGFFVSPFMKFTKGKYKYSYGLDFVDNSYQTIYRTENVNALIAGFGLGYKLVWKRKLSFSFTTDIGRVLNNSGYYPDHGPIDFRAGINMGIRF
ncbi:hypothetical protein [Emticicia sp. SJ17W-69]|uniref:hypothetical protein n=1 Tax=Emticicia sp. SJ17W-69 TaxID=3421657 RepID=UPI003EB924C5